MNTNHIKITTKLWQTRNELTGHHAEQSTVATLES